MARIAKAAPDVDATRAQSSVIFNKTIGHPSHLEQLSGDRDAEGCDATRSVA